MTKPRTCRVCGCTDDRACPGGCSWIESTLCSACVASQAHVVRMTRSYPRTSLKGRSVATCSCGKFSRSVPIAHHHKMDGLIRDHWIEAVRAAEGDHVPL
ncbi:MAG TPA: hypothetical protein VNW24_00310 [Stellaceae bacterium]|jgi:hypothetical protein|nr:hypothetical protein [Stellaceae bacterium]